MGGDNFSILWGDTAVMRGDIELMGGPQSPPLGKTLVFKCINKDVCDSYPVYKIVQVQGPKNGLF